MPVISNPAGWEEERIDSECWAAALADGLED
jgi:hypothetical protein